MYANLFDVGTFLSITPSITSTPHNSNMEVMSMSDTVSFSLRSNLLVHQVLEVGRFKWDSLFTSARIRPNGNDDWFLLWVNRLSVIQSYSGYLGSSNVLQSVFRSVNVRDPSRIDVHAGYYGWASLIFSLWSHFSQSIIYGTYTIANLFTPTAVTLIGSKKMLFIGTISIFLLPQNVHFEVHPSSPFISPHSSISTRTLSISARDWWVLDMQVKSIYLNTEIILDSFSFLQWTWCISRWAQ